MNINVEEITPEKAAMYLQLNTDNRRLRKTRVSLYADQMVRGQWLETGDPIRFSVTGRLLDGQHRLAAVLAANITIKAVIVREVPDESFRVLDSGLGRSAADALGNNTVQAVNKAAAARLLWVIEAGGDPRLTSDLSSVTRSDIAQYYADHEQELVEATLAGNRMYRAFRGGNKAAWTAFCFLLYENSPAPMVNQFLESVATGANLAANDPRLALRNWLTNHRKMTTAGGYLGVLIKSWNDHARDAKRLNVFFKDTEPFPTVLRPK